MSKELLFKNSKKGVVKSVDPIITQTENRQPIIEKLMESAAAVPEMPTFPMCPKLGFIYLSSELCGLTKHLETAFCSL